MLSAAWLKLTRCHMDGDVVIGVVAMKLLATVLTATVIVGLLAAS
jgi:hypothetical protein